MAARDNEIGRCRCPVCQSTSAHLRVSAKQLAYVVCNSCNVQILARSDRSDEKLRDFLINDRSTTVDDSSSTNAKDAEKPAPKPADDDKTKGSNKAVPPPPSAPAKKPGWGFDSW